MVEELFKYSNMTNMEIRKIVYQNGRFLLISHCNPARQKETHMLVCSNSHALRPHAYNRRVQILTYNQMH